MTALVAEVGSAPSAASQALRRDPDDQTSAALDNLLVQPTTQFLSRPPERQSRAPHVEEQSITVSTGVVDGPPPGGRRPLVPGLPQLEEPSL
jgi:hypothetical protein